MRELNDASTSWSSVSFAAIALACSSAIRLRVASMVTRRSPCFRRKSEIVSAGDDCAAAKPPKNKTNESKMANSGFILLPCSRIHKFGSTYHSFPDCDSDRDAPGTAGKVNACWLGLRATGSAKFALVRCATIRDRSRWPHGFAKFSKSPKRRRRGLDSAPLPDPRGNSGIPNDCRPRHVRRDQLEQLQPFPGQAEFEYDETGGVTARPG
jgi:hypothetical protein